MVNESNINIYTLKFSIQYVHSVIAGSKKRLGLHQYSSKVVQRSITDFNLSINLFNSLMQSLFKEFLNEFIVKNINNSVSITDYYISFPDYYDKISSLDEIVSTGQLMKRYNFIRTGQWKKNII